MLRIETKSRARALQLLYAWELRGRAHSECSPPGSPVSPVPSRPSSIVPRRWPRVSWRTSSRSTPKRPAAAENWRLSRIAVVERNILRIAIHELRRGDVPPKVAIDEAVRLAHWFGGARAPGFVNGVLDGIARATGRL